MNENDLKELGQAGNKAQAADGMALTRLLISKGIFTYAEFMAEKDRAMSVADYAAEAMPKVIELVMDEKATPEMIENLFGEVAANLQTYLEHGDTP